MCIREIAIFATLRRVLLPSPAESRKPEESDPGEANRRKRATTGDSAQVIGNAGRKSRHGDGPKCCRIN